MQPELVNATPSDPPVEPPAKVLAAYHDHQKMKGRGNTSFTRAARAFLRRWPAPRTWEDETLAVQLSANPSTRPFITFLLVTGPIHPGWEYLVHRKFSSIWRDVPGTRIGADLQEFITAAGSCGYSQPVASAMASQVMARVLFATGKPLTELAHGDFDALASAGLARQVATGRTWKHYRGCATATKTVLFHMGVLPALPEPFEQRWPFTRRVSAVPEPMHSVLVRYMQRKSVTCKPSTVSCVATRLAHFGTWPPSSPTSEGSLTYGKRPRPSISVWAVRRPLTSTRRTTESRAATES